jgi:hypothetical protein
MPEFGWIAHLDQPHPRAVPVVDAGTGESAGHLLLFRGRAKPVRAAVRIEAGLIGDGPAWAVSLVLPEPGDRLLFDDPAVVGAMRAILRDPGRTAVFSTLVDGSTWWAGALSGTAPDRAAGWPQWWRDDPFARLGRQRRLLVPAGRLRAAALPAGPGHQRHAGAPWPWGTFDGPVRPA